MGTTSSSTTASTQPPAITINGNNPATWPQNFPWHDNLGALFAHPTAAGNPVSETVYSTSTVDTTKAGTTTIDYWVLVPATNASATPEYLHATRGIVITAPANDNLSQPPALTRPQLLSGMYVKCSTCGTILERQIIPRGRSTCTDCKAKRKRALALARKRNRPRR